MGAPIMNNDYHVNQKQINLYTATIFGAVLFMCLSNNIVGPLLGDIMAHYDIRLDGGGLMSLYQNIGGTLAVILFSFVLDRLNKTLAFIAPMLLLAISLLLIGIAPPYTVFMLLFLTFGISFSSMDMTGNALVSDVQQQKRNTALSLMHGIASMGAVAAPLIAGGITESGLPWQTVYTLVGFVILAVLVVYILVSASVRKSLKAIKTVHLNQPVQGEAPEFLKDKRVWVAVLSTLMFGGYQSGILVWVSQYFKAVFGSGQLAAGLGLTAYWLGAGIVRLLFGLVPRLRNLETRPVNIYGSILAGAVLLIGVLSGSYGVMLVCVFLSGAFNAPLLPRTMGLVSGWYQVNSGVAASFVFGALYLAYSFFPLLMGSLAYAWGMNMLMLVPALCTILAGAAAVLLPRERADVALQIQEMDCAEG